MAGHAVKVCEKVVRLLEEKLGIKKHVFRAHFSIIPFRKRKFLAV